MFLNRISGQSSSSSSTQAPQSPSSSTINSSTSTRGRTSFNRKSLRLPDILRDTEMVSHLRGLCTPPPSPLYQFSFFNRASSTLTPPVTVNNTDTINNHLNNNNNNHQAFAFDLTQRRSTSSSTTASSYRIPIEMEIIRDVGDSLRHISNAFDEQRNHKALFTIIVILKFTMYFCIDCTNFGVSL